MPLRSLNSRSFKHRGSKLRCGTIKQVWCAQHSIGWPAEFTVSHMSSLCEARCFVVILLVRASSLGLSGCSNASEMLLQTELKATMMMRKQLM